MAKKKDEKKDLTFSDVILMQEAAGQAAFVTSATLPKEGLTTPGLMSGRHLVPGFVTVKGEVDDLFVNVELPAGWERRPQPGHSMWSYLLDDRGRRRAAIFYKAAFYDRNAHIHWSTRYNIVTRYLDDYGERVQVLVTDAPVGADAEAEGAVLWESAVIRGYDEQRAADKVAEVWLTERRPDWRNPEAYWDETEVPV